MWSGGRAERLTSAVRIRGSPVAIDARATPVTSYELAGQAEQPLNTAAALFAHRLVVGVRLRERRRKRDPCQRLDGRRVHQFV